MSRQAFIHRTIPATLSTAIYAPSWIFSVASNTPTSTIGTPRSRAIEARCWMCRLATPVTLIT